jgi:PAS domain S-box-containing protein
MLHEKLNLENVLQRMGDAFVSLDRQWCYTFVNDKALALMGKTRAQLLGHRIWDVFPDIIDTVFEREYNKVMYQHVPTTFETYYPTYDMWLEIRAYPHEEGLAIFYTDITRHKQAESTLRRMNVELERCVQERTSDLANALEREKTTHELKSRFVAMASHEFRTPLSSILSSVSLLERYTAPEQQAQRDKHIARIKASARLLTDILNDFLSFEKLEQGLIHIEKEPFELPALLESLTGETDGIVKNGQHVHCRHDGATAVCLDRKIMRTIVLNLLSNAIKYSEADVTLESEIRDGLVAIRVGDRGIGIPEEEQPFVFDQFFRARNATGIQGTGLGLNIVRRYVELLEGTISFVSKRGEGTVFSVEIPCNSFGEPA